MKQNPIGLLTASAGIPVARDKLPFLAMADFQSAILAGVERGWRVAALFGLATSAPSQTQLIVVMADDEQSLLQLGGTVVEGDKWPSLTPLCPQVHLFEREIAEQFGLVPVGHPWLKPVRYHHSWTDRDAWGRAKSQAIEPAVGDFYQVGGEQVHEVAVGPVHAGVIEPGHFRFQCHGELVFHLEIALGFQHRGIEQELIGGPDPRSLHLMETLAGDSTVAHATNYCHILEAASGTRISGRAQVLRGIGLELERLANHTGDLGALSGDAGFLPTASYCGRIRGDFLNLTALICGNRFGRSLVRPGGVGYDLGDERCALLSERLAIAEREAAGAINLLWDNQTVMARFEDTGRLGKEAAIELGLVGPAARATGLARDARFNQPAGIFRLAQIPIASYDSGDVFARAYVRWLEIQQSITFIKEQLATLPRGAVQAGLRPLAPDSLIVSLNEAWRGEVCHVALTDSRGRFERYKVVDPSFHNWFGLSLAMRNQEISDFPLCNKSFNLSYCGHDL